MISLLEPLANAIVKEIMFLAVACFTSGSTSLASSQLCKMALEATGFTPEEVDLISDAIRRRQSMNVVGVTIIAANAFIHAFKESY